MKYNQDIIFDEKKKEKIIEEVKKILLNLKGKYLPEILIKMGFFNSSKDARKHIRTKGVTVNNILTKNIDYQLTKGNIYIILFNNVTYLVTIL